MIGKATMLFRLATTVSDVTSEAKRIGGWSESYYYSGPDAPSMIDAFAFAGGEDGKSLCGKRAHLLPTGAAIVGQRYQLLDPVGASQSTNKVFPGDSNLLCDVPQMALLCKAPGVGVINIRQLILRGIPDIRVHEGEYSPSATFRSALQGFFSGLKQWRFRAKDQTALKYKVSAISALGIINFEGPVPVLAVNDVITLSGVKTASGQTINGQFQVKNILPLTGQVELFNWVAGACTLGKLQKVQVVFPSIDGDKITVGRVIVRKVGRPFGQYVGRRSKKKR